MKPGLTQILPAFPALRLSALGAAIGLSLTLGACRNLGFEALAQGDIAQTAAAGQPSAVVGHYKQLRDDTYLIVLQPGAKVLQSLTAFQAQTGIRTAALTGVGVVRNTVLGFYKFNADGTPSGTHTDATVQGAREVTSLICNFMTKVVSDGQPDQPAPPHCHIALAGTENPVANNSTGWPVVGGHLIEAEVGVTAELIVTTYPADVVKRPGGDFGGFLIDAGLEQGGTALGRITP